MKTKTGFKPFDMHIEAIEEDMELSIRIAHKMVLDGSFLGQKGLLKDAMKDSKRRFDLLYAVSLELVQAN